MVSAIKDIIKAMENIKVVNRNQEEHQFLIKNKHMGNVRDYLLSMGQFKKERIEEASEAEFLKWLYEAIGDGEIDYVFEIDKRIKMLDYENNMSKMQS